MNRANQLYESLARCLNLFDDLTPQELSHIACLIAAQIPHAAPGIVAVFHHADEFEVAENGERLLRLAAGVEPGSSGETMAGVKLLHAVAPEAGEPVPEVRLKRSGKGFVLDRHNTIILCKFHEQRFPTPEDFESEGASTFVIVLAYGHVDGECRVRIHPPGWSTMTLAGKFTLESFIPVRVVVDA